MRNPNDDGENPDWEQAIRPRFTAAEDKDGEGARPSSLIAVHRPAVIDPLHELNLLRMMRVANERTLRELGPPPGGLLVQEKRKPNAPYMDFLGREVPRIPIAKENDEMKLNQIAAIAALAVGTAACNPAAPIAGSVDTNNINKVAATSFIPPGQVSVHGRHTTSTLQNLLNVFVTSNAAAWSAFNSIPGMQWNDPDPIKNLEARDEERAFYRGGKLLLAGFGVVDMPNGKVGIDFGLVKGNEGNVGVTLNGDADQVYSISLVKFYPSENYQDIIQQQLQSGETVTLIADRCTLAEYGTGNNTGKNKFYEIRLAAGSVYVEASVDEDDVSTASASALGSTVFVFYRSKPSRRIAKMRCHEL